MHNFKYFTVYEHFQSAHCNKDKVQVVCIVCTSLEFDDFPNNFEDYDGRNQCAGKHHFSPFLLFALFLCTTGPGFPAALNISACGFRLIKQGIN